MNILLKQIKIADNSLFWCINTKKIEISIRELLNNFLKKQTSFTIKCKNSVCNTFFNVDDESKIVLTIKKNDKVLGHLELKRSNTRCIFNYKYLNFVIIYEFTKCDTFKFLSASDMHLQNDHLSKKVAVFSTYELRSYQYRIYSCDKTTLQTEWQNEDDDSTIKSASCGWEPVQMENNVIFWVNHTYQLVFPPGITQQIVEKDTETKFQEFKLLLEKLDSFKYLIFTKFTLFTQRHFFIQSTASYFLRVNTDLLRRSLHIKIKDEIGEDDGGIRNEFFNEVAYEISKDRRMQFTGSFLDVNPDIYEDYENDNQSNLDIPERREDRQFSELVEQNQDQLDDILRFERVTSTINRDLNDDSSGGRESEINKIWDTSEFDIDEIEMNNLRKRFYRGLNYSQIKNIKPGHTLKFWQTVEQKNKRFIEDTDPDFYKEENKGKNQLNNDEFYAYVGIYLALCFLNKEMIPIKFSYAFLENLFSADYSLKHVQDPEVQRNLLYILRQKDLSEEFLELFDDELLKKDKKLFVSKQIYEFQFFAKKRAYDIIYYFFYTLIPKEFSRIFNAQDLYFILNGKEEISFEFLRKSFNYLKCDEGTKEICFLLKILHRKNEAYYRKFLKFVTGSENISLEQNQLQLFKIHIEQIESKNELFRAASCVKMLFIGKYDTEEEMEKIMDFSIFNTEGFHKV